MLAAGIGRARAVTAVIASSYSINGLLRLGSYPLKSTHVSGRDAQSRGCRGTKAMGSVTLPPLVLAPLPLGWSQRTKIPTGVHHRMPCWHFRAAAAGMQLVAWLGRSSYVSRQLQLYHCCCYETRSLLKKYTRGIVSYFTYHRARRQIRYIISAILKVPDAAWIR